MTTHRDGEVGAARVASLGQDMVERVAARLRAVCEEFESPVDMYVEPEASRRWASVNPGRLPYCENPGVDWGFESWKILARAAIEAMREPTRKMLFAGADANDSDPTCAASWQAMIDAALGEGITIQTDGLDAEARAAAGRAYEERMAQLWKSRAERSGSSSSNHKEKE